MALDIDGIKGRQWNNDLLEEMSKRIAKEFHLPPDVVGGMPRYRQALCIGFFFKFFAHVCQELGIEHDDGGDIENIVGETQLPPFRSTQVFQASLTLFSPYELFFRTCQEAKRKSIRLGVHECTIRE